MPRKYNEQEAIAAFWSKIDRSEVESCWPWFGGKLQSGYGGAWWRGRHTGSHRVAYELANGPIPGGLQVLHRCDNPPCCNPAHLFIGTHLDNMRDKVDKGRQPATFLPFPDENRSRGADHWSNKRPELRSTGTKNGNAKLDDSKVLSMRSARSAGEPFRSIARRYGVSLATAQAAIKGETWAHVPGPVT